MGNDRFIKYFFIGVLFALMFGICLHYAFSAKAHIADHPEWDEWFAKQKIPDGTQRSCCAKSDVHLLEDNEWRVRNGNYEVITAQGWMTFPNNGVGNPGNVVLGEVNNPTGQAVAWFNPGAPYCFVAGTQS
jgi:hypothetical protein